MKGTILMPGDKMYTFFSLEAFISELELFSEFPYLGNFILGYWKGNVFLNSMFQMFYNI